MTSKKRKATERAGGATPSKRASRARAAKKQDDPIWATENANSPLVNQDLHARYCDPGTYENWTKEDWEEIHDCLPDNAPRNDDGYSVPISYFKYDPDWRRLVREFQEDLGAGRYEPQWLREAAQAMEERAAGKFDKYKEDEYEAFWGQKQKPKAEDLAGESAKIKLAELVEAGRIKLGDDLSFRRAFEKKGLGRWVIEKEIKIVALRDSVLTVAIPPGQTKYPKFQTSAVKSEKNCIESDSEEKANPSDESKVNGVIEECAHKHPSDDLSNQGEEQNHPKSVPKLSNPEGHENILIPGSLDLHQASSFPINDRLASSSPPPSKSAPEGSSGVEEPSKGVFGMKTGPETASDLLSVSETMDAKVKRNDEMVSHMTVSNGTFKNSQESYSGQKDDAIDPETGCILHQVKTIKSFVDKIIEIDGRLDPKVAAVLSNWRLIRLQRQNQDLGSLFDVREEFYVWRSPDIVKMPKKDRGSGKVQAESQDLKGFGKSAPQQSKQGPKRRSSASRAAAKDGDNEIVTEESDEDAAVEPDSDSDFKATKTYSSKLKSRTRAKTISRQPNGLSRENDEVAGDHELSKEKEEIPRAASTKSHVCPACGKNFATDYSRRRHIERYCKGVPKE